MKLRLSVQMIFFSFIFGAELDELVIGSTYVTAKLKYSERSGCFITERLHTEFFFLP